MGNMNPRLHVGYKNVKATGRMEDKEPRLQGTVLEIVKTGKKMKDEGGTEWEQCAFTLKLRGYSKRTPDLTLPHTLRGKKVKISRYCAHEWHYKLNGVKTLTPDETKQVHSGKTDLTKP